MSQHANDDFSQHLSDDEASNHEDASENSAAPNQQKQQLTPTTTTISNIKLPILQKEEYDIWAMEMEHYLKYIDNDVWKVIQNGNSKKRISTGKDGVIRVLPPISAAEIHAAEKERKARNILLMALPKDHLKRFHGMDDAKEIWEAIRTRFGGNANSKKMQKAILKQQFKAFSISSSEGLEKGYDRFLKLLSQLEAHGSVVSNEDANHKFLRSLPAAWSHLAMIMRIKLDVDTLSIDDLRALSWKPLYSRFKTSDFKGVPHPLSGDYTPKPQEEIDDSLYVYGKKGPQKPETSVSDDKSSKYSTCQSNDSEGSFGTSTENSVDLEPEVLSVPKVVSASKPKEVEPSCDSHKMAKEDELKKQRVPNTRNRVAKPVWNDATRINHANYFVPRPVQLNPVRTNVNPARTNVKSVKQKVNSGWSKVNTGSFNINTARTNQPKTTNSTPSFNPARPQDHPLKNMGDRGIFDSGCSGHMTGNKDHLENFKEFKGGSVTFGGSKDYITGKGRIKVGNLDFDSVSFEKELGNFNLFSISQICDTQYKVLFTETECLVVSLNFKMPDENQILLK
ncbi:hypothetical protein Tco_0987630, partial [Tanacetum coccineum]